MSSENPTHKEIDDRLVRGELRFKTIEDKLDSMLRIVAVIPEIQQSLVDMPQMKEDIAKTREVIEFANTITNGIKYLKVVAMVAASLLSVWAFIKFAVAGAIRSSM